MSFVKLYLTANAAPYAPATIRGAWDDTGGAVAAKALDTTKDSGGALTSVARAETNAAAEYDVLLGRWVSGPLAAQTLSGTLNVVIAVKESGAAADLNWHLHVYVTQGNTDTPRGTLISDYREAAGVNEWTTDSNGKGLALNAAQAITLAVSAGDRLVVEIGFAARNVVTTSFTGTLYYGTMAASGLPAADLAVGGTDGNVKAGFLTFSQAVAEMASTARVSQAFAEAASYDPAPSALVPQVFVEVATPVVVAVPAYVSHVFAEAAGEAPNVVPVVPQIFVEVATRNIVDPCAAPTPGEDLTTATTGPLLFTVWDPLGTQRVGLFNRG